jgi:hypothetical protein
VVDLVVFAVRFPAVVDEDLAGAEPGQDAGVVHRGGAAFGVDGVMGEQGGGQRMQPVEPAGRPEPGLVGVGDGGGGEQVLQHGEEGLGFGGGVPGPGADASGGDGAAEQVGHGLGGPLVGREPAGGEVAGRGADSGPVLGGGVHAVGGGCRGGGAAVGAAEVFEAVFGDLDEFFGEVEDPAAFGGDGFGVVEGGAAAGAGFGPVGEGAVGVVGLGEGFPLVSGLFPGFAAGPGPQGFRRGFRVSLRRRRGVGVPRVGGEAFLQLGDPFGEGGELRLQPADGLVFLGDGRVPGRDRRVFLRDDPPVFVRVRSFSPSTGHSIRLGSLFPVNGPTISRQCSGEFSKRLLGFGCRWIATVSGGALDLRSSPFTDTQPNSYPA